MTIKRGGRGLGHTCRVSGRAGDGASAASTATLSQTDGVNKSQYLTMDSAYQAHTNASTNLYNMARATLSQANAKGHFECRLDAISADATSANGTMISGIGDDGTVTAVGAAVWPAIGVSAPGAMCLVTRSSTTANVFANGGQTTYTLPAIPAVGDAIIVDHDATAHTVHFRWFRAADSSVTNLVTVTLTSQIPATPYAICGSYMVGDKFTFNPGNAAFLVTPDTGFTVYG